LVGDSGGLVRGVFLAVQGARSVVYFDFIMAFLPPTGRLTPLLGRNCHNLWSE